MNEVYKKVLEFKNKYPGGVYWFRLKKHSAVVERHLNPDEKVLYAFAAQKNNSVFDVFSTAAIVLTTKRLIIGQKRLVWGYMLNTITPDLFNDMQIYQGLLFGQVTIDTAKETIYLTNIAKKALPEIETQISTFMIREKQKYAKNISNNSKGV